MKDDNEAVRRSIKRDFAKANFKRNGRMPRTAREKDVKRIVAIGEGCEYWRLRRFLLGRLVRILEDTGTGVWVEFVREGDRENLNNAAGWSEYKRRYFLQGAKFN